MMVRKTCLLAAVLSVFCLLAPAADGFFGTNPTYEAAEWELIYGTIDSSLINIPLPQTYVDFIAEQIFGGPLKSIRLASLPAGKVARTITYSSGTWEVLVGELSTWEAVNVENLVHELAHKGAGGTGNDAKGYDKTKEVNARKREAEAWRDAADNPDRDSGQDQGCGATYDMVFNKNGTQRSHEEIRVKLYMYGYWSHQM